MSISGGRQEVIGTATSQEGTEWSGERREKGKRRVTIMLSWISREFFSSLVANTEDIPAWVAC